MWTTQTHIHFSDCIPHTAKLGKLIYALLFDDRAVHIETDSFCSPEELLCLWECCHYAGKNKRQTHSMRHSKTTAALGKKGANNSGLTEFDVCDFVRQLPAFIVWLSPACSGCLLGSGAANTSIDWNTCVQTFLHQRSSSQINTDPRPIVWGKSALHKVCLHDAYDRPLWTPSGRIASPPGVLQRTRDGEQKPAHMRRRWHHPNQPLPLV